MAHDKKTIKKIKIMEKIKMLIVITVHSYNVLAAEVIPPHYLVGFDQQFWKHLGQESPPQGHR